MSVILVFDVGNHLGRLVVDGRKLCLDAQGESIHLDSNDTETVLQQVNQRQEYLIGYSQPRYEHQRGRPLFTKYLEIHYFLVSYLNKNTNYFS